jgi:hypothetical protein
MNRFKGKVRDVDLPGFIKYLELVMEFPLTSIKSEDQLEEAQRVMDQLLTRGELNAGEEMYLDALSDLVALYEDEYHSIPTASMADILLHRIDTKGIKRETHRGIGYG